MRALDVGIVGCGTAGAAAALFLARAGHRVTVYERVENPGPIGAGIVMQPTGLAVLGELGLRDAIVDHGARIDRLRCETHTKKRIVHLEYGDLEPGLFGVGLHRGVLFANLFAAVKREGIDLRLGVAGEDLARADGDRLFLVDAQGRRHGPHELIVVADGARSRLRDDTPNLRKSIAEYAWGALWFVAKDPEARFHSELHQIVRGNHRMLGFLPTGRGPSGANTPLVSVYWSIRGDRVSDWRSAGLAAWKDEVLEYAPHAEPLLAQIESPEQMLFAVYHDVTMSRWNAHNVVYLGDAAHAMSPQLGQGCNLALVDAWTLAQSIGDHEHLPVALSAYTGARADHLRFYQLATRWLTPLFQSDVAALGHARDLVMGTMSRVPVFNRMMAASMCGTMTGVISRLRLPGASRASRAAR
jgi:2-polyprenyl-6-methoxyphenol hydroxylase-like FAD-dependent oxidoreductase